MSTIHMDLIWVNAVLGQLTQEEGEIRDTLKNLKAEVESIDGNRWVGPAAEEFFSEYEGLNGRLITQIDALELLIGRMKQEIAEWEAMAAKLA
ncbi:MAG: WXG100 family type VII secretion target [Anaerolineales bacterium]|nr:WXG100 family type VII secretion target [Anaerolineales bacterium]